ncbi:10779_t:CDS:2, partial [Gigaspora rosea]
MSLTSVVFNPIKTHTATVVFSHGLGDSGDGIAPAFLSLSKMLGHVKFIFPNAPSRPITVNGGMIMPAWYDISSLGENIEEINEDEEGMLNSVRGINGIIRDEIDSGIPSNRIVIGGFSQGSAMALLVGLTSEYRFAGIAVLSGYLPLRNKIFKIKNYDNVTTGAEKLVELAEELGSDDNITAMVIRLPAWGTKMPDHTKALREYRLENDKPAMKR